MENIYQEYHYINKECKLSLVINGNDSVALIHNDNVIIKAYLEQNLNINFEQCGIYESSKIQTLIKSISNHIKSNKYRTFYNVRETFWQDFMASMTYLI
jgi:hypothetical protein